MPDPAADRDLRIRLAAFEWLREQADLYDGVLPWTVLSKGFEFEGARVPLVAMQGIFKPKVLPEIPLTIRTASHDPYHDDLAGDGGVLRYAYRGNDPWHRDNRGLRLAMERRVPLIYLYGIAKGKYVPAWPVLIVGDDPAHKMFTVQIEDSTRVGADVTRIAEGLQRVEPPAPDAGADARRSYITRAFQARLHQRAFRERVLGAYKTQCALCRLRHEELLDAAHIIGDTEPDGDPVIPNGLALCKLHHAAYDRHFLTVTPAYVIEVRPSILAEEDGPMLLHGLKEMHGREIYLPHHREHHPDRERLERRYRRFRAAG
jgi:putative restriction endonuclease